MKIGKLMRYLQFLMQAAQVNPRYAQRIEKELDMNYVVKTVGEQMEVDDMDKLFPNYNPTAEIAELEEAVEGLSSENNFFKQAYQNIMNRIDKLGDESAKNAVKEGMAETMEVSTGA